ncbi:mycothiol system anti-sigma-R factor [Actinomyces sp. zg-332]|uniref:mycothiol system anti-sigma-R factor n=1 Tax=Actinomyces sp. zg-332 TaxID=2708340 RepID=UPI001421EDB3|nr:mycothiol system anti-sigma-R factor [Actinomyces sp. zg-332]QPK94397.1 mycothiol system anti-sigma-R factor [Actinomyces sp. zg-332]
MSCEGKDKSTCEELIENLFQYVDNELDEKMDERFQIHIQKCGHCKDYAEAERHVRYILKKKCCDKAPTELKDKIHSQLIVLNKIINDEYKM